MRFVLVPFAAALLGLGLSAQVVSPVGFASKEGNAANTFPWFGLFHYQQMHGDLRGNAFLVKGQAHRRDGVTTFFRGQAGPRTLEITIWAGEGDLTKISPTFLSNYVGQKTLVFKKASVNLPDWRPLPPKPPGPFDLVIPYTQPVPYTGKLDLVWEMVISKTTAPLKYYFGDAVSRSGNNLGTAANLGTGCIATGQTRPMFLRATFRTKSTASQVELRLSATLASKGAAGAFLLGLRDLNLRLPGACAALHSDGIIALMARSSLSGTMSLPLISFPYNPAFPKLPGIFLQAMTLDSGQRGIPVAASQGVKATIAATGIGKFARVWRGNPTATTGAVSKGFALVTRFTK